MVRWLVVVVAVVFVCLPVEEGSARCRRWRRTTVRQQPAQMPAELQGWVQRLKAELKDEIEKMKDGHFADVYTRVLPVRVEPCEFRRWCQYFVEHELEWFLAAVLDIFAPSERAVLIQRVQARGAPKLAVRFMGGSRAGETDPAEGEITLDPSGLSDYARFRNVLAHELVHHLVDGVGSPPEMYTPIREGVTEYLTACAFARFGWPQAFFGHPDETLAVAVLMPVARDTLLRLYVQTTADGPTFVAELGDQLVARGVPAKVVHDVLVDWDQERYLRQRMMALAVSDSGGDEEVERGWQKEYERLAGIVDFSHRRIARLLSDSRICLSASSLRSAGVPPFLRQRLWESRRSW